MRSGIGPMHRNMRRQYWEILQFEVSCDIMIGTGEVHSVRVCKQTFSNFDLPCEKHVKNDPRYFRPKLNSWLRILGRQRTS
jgi:hypothetical protein